jgi:hypothetical protein
MDSIMARNRGKKALYEVMSKARVKPEHGTIVEHSRPKKTVEEAPAPRHKESAGAVKSTAKWWKKPRIVQFNAGRIEFSMPYQIAVVLLLVFIFLIVASYRLGQSVNQAANRQPDTVTLGMKQPETSTQQTDNTKLTERATSDFPPPSAPPENVTAKTEAAEPVEPTGNNVIVVVEYNSLPDLAPVQVHFAEYGIDLVIVPENGRYFLQTKQLYDNPSRPGTDGYQALQKIKEVGKKYKAPTGYETFASKLFQDAYGKKVK